MTSGRVIVIPNELFNKPEYESIGNLNIFRLTHPPATLDILLERMFSTNTIARWV